MKQCRHRNVVALYEVIDDPQTAEIYLIMQLVEKGSILKLSPQGIADRRYSAKEVAFFGRQICAGMCYLHEHGVVHRDIKPDNILLGCNDTVYLSDFGVSELFLDYHHDGSTVNAHSAGSPLSPFAPNASSPASGVPSQFARELVADATGAAGSPPNGMTHKIEGRRGTRAFLAPELFSSRAAVDGKAVDVWALGVTFYTMLVGKLPWDTSDARKYTKYTNSRTPDYPPSLIPPMWQQILRGMLQVDPARRMSSEDVRRAVKVLQAAYAAGLSDQTVAPPSDFVVIPGTAGQQGGGGEGAEFGDGRPSSSLPLPGAGGAWGRGPPPPEVAAARASTSPHRQGPSSHPHAGALFSAAAGGGVPPPPPSQHSRRIAPGPSHGVTVMYGGGYAVPTAATPPYPDIPGHHSATGASWVAVAPPQGPPAYATTQSSVPLARHHGGGHHHRSSGMAPLSAFPFPPPPPPSASSGSLQGGGVVYYHSPPPPPYSQGGQPSPHGTSHPTTHLQGSGGGGGGGYYASQ